MKLIPLSQGMFAKVDDYNYDNLIKWKWHTLTHAGKTYARTWMLIDGKTVGVLLHRFVKDVWNPEILVDHEDGDGLNCQGYNLRECSHVDNMRNRIKRSKTTTSMYKGVYKIKPTKGKNGELYHREKPWKASINVNKKSTMIGTFHTEVEAALAYNESAKVHFGSFASVNIISKDDFELIEDYIP